jgi:UDP-N-acetylmuramoyl-tripeptide--D-alanyl-D-alanine ligase
MRRILGATVIDDCYNSNPAALRAMTETLMSVPAKRRIVVAGEMLELGRESRRLHYECGEFIARRGVDIVVGVRGQALSIAAGAKDAGADSLFLETPEDAGAWLRGNLRAGDAVLLKASRGVKLERALEVLESEP